MDIFLKILSHLKKENFKKDINKYLTLLESAKYDMQFRNYSNKKVLFVLPEVSRSSGGINSLLKLGYFLASYGWEIYYTCNTNLKISECIEILKKNYNCKIKFIKFEDAVQSAPFQFVVTTYFLTFGDSFKIKGNHIIFLQDFEPFFYEKGDMDFIFKECIEKHILCITLGQWIKDKLIENNIFDSSRIKSIQFPADLSYYSEKKEYISKNEINIAVYNRRTSRRLPFVAEWIAVSLQKEFAKHNIKCKVYLFGNNHKRKYKNKNIIDLGIIDKTTAVSLYEKSDFGISFSCTNVSLVPFEMTLSGLPLILLKGDSFEGYLGDDCFYYDNISHLCQSMTDYFLLDSSDKKRLAIKRISKIKDNNWHKTSQDFSNILNIFNK